MYTPIQLDKTRNLLLGFEGMKLFKNMTGTSISKLDYENEDMEDYIPTMIYCALVHEDKELTLESTIQLIDKTIGVRGAIEILPKLMEETFGKQNDVKNAPGVAKKK